MPGLNVGVRRLLDTIYPPRCVVCGRVGAVVCADCLKSMRSPAAPTCAHCDATISDTGSSAVPRLCPDCAAGRRLAYFDGVRVTVEYTGAARTAVIALKFGGQRRVAERLATLMSTPFWCDIKIADIVIPMPLHASRKRERGYNQAALLAGPVARALALPLRDDALARVRATRPQTHLHRDARRANVAGAFALTGPAAARALAGQRILLIDDVTTTGATLESAAEALLDAQPAAIYAAAVARPLRDLWPAGAEPPDH